jgi:hypothetical protein
VDANVRILGDHSSNGFSTAFCFYHWQITSLCYVVPVNTQKNNYHFLPPKLLLSPMIDLTRQGNKSFLYDGWGEMEQMTTSWVT